MALSLCGSAARPRRGRRLNRRSVRRRGLKHLFLITILARPREGTEAFADSGGAYVNAWVDAPNESEAIATAEREVREAGWVTESIEDTAQVCQDDYDQDDPNLQYFEQALIDKEVFVFNVWPLEPQEEDAVH